MQSFRLVKPTQLGYNTQQVDVFFNQVRDNWTNKDNPVTEQQIRFQNFAPMKGGYDMREVDEGLIRLEQALAAREKHELVEKVKLEGWIQTVNNRIAELYATLSSAAGTKFSRPNADVKSYSTADVDKFLALIKEQLFDGKDRINSIDIRAKQFNMTRGSNGYLPIEVDYFLDEVISIFNQLEVE